MTQGESSSRGEFFIIDLRIWSLVCLLGLNEAVSYLVLATGTDRANKKTYWSMNAVQNYSGMTFSNAKAAIERLIKAGVLKRLKGGTKPCYEFLTWSEWSIFCASLQEQTLTPFELKVLRTRPTSKQQKVRDAYIKLGELNYLTISDLAPQDDELRVENLIWLPKAIVMGTKAGESSPVERLRHMQKATALRLFVNLYHVHNLRDDLGIPISYFRQNYKRKQLISKGAHLVYTFKFESSTLWYSGPLEFYCHISTDQESRRKTAWGDIGCLTDLGLIDFVPHLCEGLEKSAQLIHACGRKPGCPPGSLEHAEFEVTAAATLAARLILMAQKHNWQVDGDQILIPIEALAAPEVQMFGVARLRYRPYTSRTSIWYESECLVLRRRLEYYNKIAGLEPK